MASVLIVSFVEWTGAFQRPQHMALGFAKRGWRVTYVNPGFLHRRAARFDSGLTLPENLKIVQPAQLPGASRSELISGWNQKLMRRALARLNAKEWDAPINAEVKKLRPDPPEFPDFLDRRAYEIESKPFSSLVLWDAIIFNDPRMAPALENIPVKVRVFDCMDDLSAASPSAEWAARMEARAVAAADFVWTGTSTLADRLAGKHPSVRFIPGGVDAERFANPVAAEVESARADLPPGDGPLAGYFGVLNERFDMSLIQALLDSGPWRVLLIGPATSRAPAIPDHPRLRFIGPRPYAKLPAYLAHFDLGLIPYFTTGSHRFLYPVKGLEYLAGGKPVLATPLPDIVRFLGEAVELADGAAAWREAGDRLLSPGAEVRLKAEAGRRLAFSRSWDAMADEMAAAITAALPGGAI